MTDSTFEAQAAGALQVEVEPGRIDVEPGRKAAVTVRVHSSVQDTVDVDVRAVGPQSAWCDLSPATVVVEPATHAETKLTVQVPLQLASSPGTVIVGVRAASSRKAVLPHVAELFIRVPVTTAVRLDLVPAARRVSGRARFTAVVRNDGRSPVRVALQDAGPAPEVRTRIRPSVVTVPAGGRARSVVRVRAPVPWNGPEPEHQVVLRAVVGEDHVEALGSVVQRTRTGTALLVVALALVALALVLVSLMVADASSSTDTTEAAAEVVVGSHKLGAEGP